MKGGWVEPDIRDEIVDFVAEKKQQCYLSELFLLKLIGIDRRKFFDWKQAYGHSWEVGQNLPKSHWIRPWEKELIINFYLNNEHDGYRRCAYMMMDQDLVYVAPSTVYVTLKDAGVIRSRNVKKSKKGTGFEQPLKPHEHWHSDITNVSIGDTIYFLISIIDGYSRSVIAWDLRKSMKSQDVGIVFQKAKEKYPYAKPRCISDNGKQYKCKEFRTFIANNGYSHVTTSPYYPQSNGKQERFHGSLKSECIRLKCPLTMEDAIKVISEYIEHYNENRLHSSINYIAPLDKLNGKELSILTRRDENLKKMRSKRREWAKAS